jgi:hypothetical protein
MVRAGHIFLFAYNLYIGLKHVCLYFSVIMLTIFKTAVNIMQRLLGYPVFANL